MTSSDLPNIDTGLFRAPTNNDLFAATPSDHKPRILLLYGSLRERSYSRLANEEAARILRRFGCETRMFDPRGLLNPGRMSA